MHSISRMRASWHTMQSEKPAPATRRSILRSTLVSLLVLSGTCLFIVFISTTIGHLFMKNNGYGMLKLGEDAFIRFTGKECHITQSSLYKILRPTTQSASPFCRNRAELLSAMSSGGRHGVDEPFVGTGCTYKWFSTPEICMILERHNSITFLGDKTAQSIYTALNILLSEDLALGGLQQRRLGRDERENCACESQFLRKECVRYALKSSDEAKRNGGKTNAKYCGRVSHAYIPVSTTPAPLTSIKHFKDLTYDKPHPWQTSPLIFSFAAQETATTAIAINEWNTLAKGAQRKIPMLFLGAHATKETSEKIQAEIAKIATEKHWEVLGLYNLTLQASVVDGEGFGMDVALVEAMIVVNWLSKVSS